MPLTVAVGGKSIGRAPLGPGSPSFEPIHNLIRVPLLNLRAMPWTREILFHRGLPGRRPNLAPVGLSYVGARMQARSPRRIAHPTAQNFGNTWAGVGG